MVRGRPVGSEIRQNIVEILFHLSKACGYDIYKHYRKLFPACTREVIYYHLKKGLATGEFELEEVRQEKGKYSWGSVVEKKYYKLGPAAAPHGEVRVKEFFGMDQQKSAD